MTPPVALPDDLISWAEGVAGATLVKAVRLPGGARKEAWALDFDGTEGPRPLFLRYDRSDPSTTLDPWTLHREASVYAALQDTDVLVPRLLAVHPTHQAMLSERLTGEAWFSRITDDDEARSTAQHFMEQLAALHRLDPGTLPLECFPEPTTIPAMVAWELDEWERIIGSRGGEPVPQLAFGLEWLRRNVPDAIGPVVLVQGDTGPGNFMYRDGHVVAVVDWELAHLGDPMDDIAWLTLRCTQTPLPDLPTRLREYESMVGWEVDDGRVHYYQVMAETKLLVMKHRPAERNRYATVEGGGADIGNRLIYDVLHQRLWFEAIGPLVGLTLDLPPPSSREGGEHTWLYDAVLGQLRDVIAPSIRDPLALQRAKGLARIVKYLREVDLHGAEHAAAELDELGALLGERPTGVEEGRRAVVAAARAGMVSDGELLEALWRRTARVNELLRPASGALADRHWPPLR
jgi:aminoglycoside phosphotransferase (APT) family kinase protein